MRKLAYRIRFEKLIQIREGVITSRRQIWLLGTRAEDIINKGKSLYHKLGADLLEIEAGTLNWISFIETGIGTVNLGSNCNWV